MATRACGGSRITARRPSTVTTAARPVPSAAPARWLQAHVLSHLREGAPLENAARDYLANLAVQDGHLCRSHASGQRVTLADFHPETPTTNLTRKEDVHETGSHSPAVAASAIGLAMPVAAQAVLKFSHTDQQSGARQAAAELFAKKVGELTRAATRCRCSAAARARQRPEEHRAARPRRH